MFEVVGSEPASVLPWVVGTDSSEQMFDGLKEMLAIGVLLQGCVNLSK
jgi:hypothetical protein